MYKKLENLIMEYPSLLKIALVERDTLRYQKSLQEESTFLNSEDKVQLVVFQANLKKTQAALEAAKARAVQELLEKNPKVTAAAMEVAAQADRDVIELRRILIDQEEEIALFMAQSTVTDNLPEIEEKLIKANAEVKAVEAILEMFKLLVTMDINEVEL